MTSGPDVLVADLKAIFAIRLQAVVLYGPHAIGPKSGHPVHTLVVVRDLGLADLEAAARRMGAWRQAGLAVPLVMAAQPILDQVSAAIHESCSLAIQDGDEILYVARSSASTRIMSIDLGVGSRLPANCTSMGRVLLAGLADDELAAFLRRVKLTPFTHRTIVQKDALADAIARVRRQQYAVVDQELEIGLRSIAVPVKDFRQRVAAAINVSVQATRVSVAEMEKTFLPALDAAAQELGMLLG